MAIFAPAAFAQIYHCETEDGPVFSDTPCGEQAKVVELQPQSSGVAGGPPAETKAYLAQKREEREEARAEQQRLEAMRPREPVYVPVPVETESYPAFWPRYGGHHRPRPPGHRPGRPGRPGGPGGDRPGRPPGSPDDGPGSGGSVLKPRGR